MFLIAANILFAISLDFLLLSIKMKINNLMFMQTYLKHKSQTRNIGIHFSIFVLIYIFLDSYGIVLISTSRIAIVLVCAVIAMLFNYRTKKLFPITIFSLLTLAQYLLLSFSPIKVSSLLTLVSIITSVVSLPMIIAEFKYKNHNIN